MCGAGPAGGGSLLKPQPAGVSNAKWSGNRLVAASARGLLRRLGVHQRLCREARRDQFSQHQSRIRPHDAEADETVARHVHVGRKAGEVRFQAQAGQLNRQSIGATPSPCPTADVGHARHQVFGALGDDSPSVGHGLRSHLIWRLR